MYQPRQLRLRSDEISPFRDATERCCEIWGWRVWMEQSHPYGEYRAGSTSL